MSNKYLGTILHRVGTGELRCSANEVEDDVRRNVTSILNARMIIPKEYILRPLSSRNAELFDNSLVNFGIADLQSLNLGDETMESRFCNSVRLAIERFEPRLNNVSVEMAPPGKDRLLNIDVKATLVVPPFDEIHFESGVLAGESRFSVS